MAQTDGVILLRKNIRIRQHEHLIFDKERDWYRIAYYRPRRPGETGFDVPADIHDGMTRAAMIPKKPRDYWVRVTLKTKHLKDGIAYVLHRGRANIDTEHLFQYIASTEWGEHLL